MKDSIREQKSQLRKECRAVRKSLAEDIRAQASLAICGHIESWSLFQASRTILTYMPIRFEADLTSLLGRYPEKHWALPRIVPAEDHRMEFHPYDTDRLVQHPFGMLEPAPDSPVIAEEEIELTLVPGLAYDRRGYRLGYGGGYYDRFLSRFGGVSAGIIFHALWLDSVPRDEHDVPLKWVVTEDELAEIKK